MAENIGKIVVSIEAEVAELRKGLASAEAEFKKSADKLAAEQSKLSSRFKKSWTELASKISVVTTALNVAERTLKGLKDAMHAFGEEGASSSEKVGGAILAFGAAGIPIISDIINTSEALVNVWMELTGAMDEIRRLTQEQARMDAFANTLRSAIAYSNSLESILFTQTLMTQIAIARANSEEDVTAQFQLQRAAIEKNFAIQNRIQDESLAARTMSETQKLRLIREREILQTNILNELGDREELAFAEWKKREERRQDILEENAEKKKQREIDDAKAIADKTMDLQTRLNIMLAKQAGDDEKARTLAIEARYKKMMEGATAAQQKIIQEMKAIELMTPAAAAGGGGTATVQTAVGSFTVSSGAIETKKQTSLLKRIATATEKMSTPTSWKEAFILAAG